MLEVRYDLLPCNVTLDLALVLMTATVCLRHPLPEAN
jgi:hypothetical protein